MPKTSVKVVVVGGQATAAPPLGPALGPLGVNIGAVVGRINEVTKDFQGMKVPVTVTVDTQTKEFQVEMGMPTTSAMIAKELKLEKGSSSTGKEVVGDLSFEKAVSIAVLKFRNKKISLKSKVLQVLGTCISMGVTIDGKSAKEVSSVLKSGDLDKRLMELVGETA